VQNAGGFKEPTRLRRGQVQKIPPRLGTKIFLDGVAPDGKQGAGCGWVHKRLFIINLNAHGDGSNAKQGVDSQRHDRMNFNDVAPSSKALCLERSVYTRQREGLGAGSCRRSRPETSAETRYPGSGLLREPRPRLPDRALPAAIVRVAVAPPRVRRHTNREFPLTRGMRPVCLWLEPCSSKKLLGHAGHLKRCGQVAELIQNTIRRMIGPIGSRLHWVSTARSRGE
jgi:hypothetical protein